MKAPGFPLDTFPAEGRTPALGERNGAGLRRPPPDAAAFADIISKLAEAPQARWQAASGPGGDGAATGVAAPHPDTVAEPAPGAAEAADGRVPPSRFGPRPGHAVAPPAPAAARAGEIAPDGRSATAEWARVTTTGTFLAEPARGPGAAMRTAAEPVAPAAGSVAGAGVQAADPADHPRPIAPTQGVVTAARDATGHLPGLQPAVAAPPHAWRDNLAPALRAAAHGEGEPGPGGEITELEAPGSVAPEAVAPEAVAPALAPTDAGTAAPPAGAGQAAEGGQTAFAAAAEGRPAPGDVRPAAADSVPAGSPAPAATREAAPVPAPLAGAPEPAAPERPAEGPGAPPAPAEARAAERVTARVRGMQTHFAPVTPRRAGAAGDPSPASPPAPAGAPAAPTDAARPAASQGTAPAATVAPTVPAAASAVPPTPRPAPSQPPAGGQTAARDATITLPAGDGREPRPDRTAPRASSPESADTPSLAHRSAAGRAAPSDERRDPAPAANVRAAEPASPAPSDAPAATDGGAGPPSGSFTTALRGLAQDIGDAARAAAGGAAPSGRAQPEAHAPALSLRRDVEIDLSSSEFGVVKVRMRLTGSSLELRLRTDDATTLARLAEHRSALEQAISETGVEAKVVDIARASTPSGTATATGSGPGWQPPTGSDGRDASGQRFDQGASPERRDGRPTEDQPFQGTTSDEDPPARPGSRAGTLFV